MHTPDGFLTSWICILLMILSVIPIVLSLRNLQKKFTKSKVIAIAAISTIIFLAQMINFPILNGTSGHLIGASVALFILGVDGAVIAMTSVLLVQALVFGDGGMIALGANIFNMAIIGVYSADWIRQKIKTISKNAQIVVSSFTSVVCASILASIELALSGTVGIGLVLPAMVITHSVIGIGEGLLAIFLVGLFAHKLKMPSLKISIAISGISFLVIAALLPFASTSPDGLERVAINLGFYELETLIYSAPVPGYALPLFATVPYIASVSAALIGAILTFLLSYSSIRLVSSRIK
ncbi:MAG: energy-coupling factor ABC transporter permease [Candidatus Micrarchaeota archaeon]|nr:energy-coupling factor ABC transporter permease [Candidatus Micrarchaeota archaeon]MBU1681565.1 energy-coupling factor ABC transporter permease [Candidatus Micrarchaeota archaeon]